MGRVSLVAALLSLTVAPGCKSKDSTEHSETAPSAVPAAAFVDKLYLDGCREDVVTFFDAAARGDCQVLGAMAPETAAAPAACEKFLHAWKEKESKLLEIVDVKPDGRNPEVVIVTARVFRTGQPRRMVVRVERRQGRRVLVL